MKFERLNPLTGEVASSAVAMPASDMPAIAAKAAAAFPAWAAQGPNARRIQSGICHVNGPTVHDEAHPTLRIAGPAVSGSTGQRPITRPFPRTCMVASTTTTCCANC
jgi:hypothetical protein